MKKICILLVSVFIFLSSACSQKSEDIMLITSQSSPDGSYTVSLYQIGEPVWSFGPVRAKLVLENAKGETIDEESFQLFNDGGDVFAENIEEVTWLENCVEILMGESDTTRQYTYVLDYSK